MKHYKLQDGTIRAIGEETDIDGDQSFLVQSDWVLLTDAEYQLAINPPLTAEQLLAQWKVDRQTQVDNITVTYNSIVYQGDEVSQTRMSRAIVALPDDTTTIQWVANDNSIQSLTRVDLKAILVLSGNAQTAIWTAGRPS